MLLLGTDASFTMPISIDVCSLTDGGSQGLTVVTLVCSNSCVECHHIKNTKATLQDGKHMWTSTVAAELGVDSATVVKAELYKLLLYQEGDHFIPHRDTEKTDRMFATMTILLPSQHMVSNLCITHCI